MKVLVIGGTRFFGRRLVSNLLEEGAEVTLLTRGITSDSFGQRVQRLRADRTQAGQLEAAIGPRRFDVVYDQVCYQPDQAAAACQIFQGKTQRYIFASSMYVYSSGQALKEDQLDLSMAYPKELPRTPLAYAEGKIAAEAVFARGASFPVVSVRFPIIIGQDDYTGRLSFHLDRLLKNEPIYIPLPSAKMNYLSSHEAGRFLSWLKDISFSGPINAASRDVLSAEQVVDQLGGLLDRRPEVVRQAAPGIPASPYHRADHLWMDVSQAERLGFAFETFSEGLFKEVNPILTAANLS